MALKLNDRDCKILHAALLHGGATAEKIGELVSEQGYQVRRSLSYLQKEGIIFPYTLINQFSLGWMKVGVYFSFLPCQGQNIQAITKKLTEYENIVSLVELFGPYQYFMSINVRVIPELEDFMARLCEDIPSFKIDESISLRHSLTLFKRKYLNPEQMDQSHLTYSLTGEAAELDDVSVKVLNAIICGGGLPNGPAIAELTGVSNTTVHNKIKDLEDKGVIVGYSYSLDPQKINYHSYDLLIKASTRSPAFKKDFFDFCSSHIHIVGITECIGFWQYEVRIEVESPHQATEISQDMLNKFSEQIHKIDIVNVCQEIKYMKTPLIKEKSSPTDSPIKKRA